MGNCRLQISDCRFKKIKIHIPNQKYYISFVMSEYKTTVILRDEYQGVNLLDDQKAVDYVKAAIDAYQHLEGISLYKVRASKSSKVADNSTSTNNAMLKLLERLSVASKCEHQSKFILTAHDIAVKFEKLQQ